jgi:hypothetical protein
MFVNVHEFSPVPKNGYPDINSVEFEQFWQEQLEYVKNGFSVGGQTISGDHYWYLNFWKIRGYDYKKGRKSIISPRFLDIDYEYFSLLDRARRAGKNLIALKPRQRGFSSKNAAIIGKEFSLFPGSQSIIVAGLETYTINTMGFVLRGLNDLAETEFYKRRDPNQSDYIKASYTDIYIDEYGNKKSVVKGYQSEVEAITAKNNPQAVSGKSPSFILFEEAGIFQQLKKAYGYVKPSLVTENQITSGIAIFQGTGGEMSQGAEEFEYIYYNPDEFNALSFDLTEFDSEAEPGVKCGYFFPGWKYKIIDTNGNSLKEESLKQIEKERLLVKGGDTEFETIIADPLNPADSFLRRSGGFFSKSLVASMNGLKNNIQKTKNLQVAQKGRLEWVYKKKERDGREIKIINGVEFVPDDDGFFELIERPAIDPNTGKTKEGLYKIGIDSYDKDEANSSDSKLSVSVFKAYESIMVENNNSFIAQLFVRPDVNEGGAEKAYEEAAKVCMYFNNKALIEWSNIRIFNWFKTHGFEKFLRERPDFVLSNWIQNSTVNNRYGVDPSTKEDWLFELNDYLIKNWEKLRILRQINAFIFFKLNPKYNCDITISSSLAIVQAKEDMLNRINETSESDTKTDDWIESGRLKEDVHGNIILN